MGTNDAGDIKARETAPVNGECHGIEQPVHTSDDLAEDTSAHEHEHMADGHESRVPIRLVELTEDMVIDEVDDELEMRRGFAPELMGDETRNHAAKAPVESDACMETQENVDPKGIVGKRVVITWSGGIVHRLLPLS